MEKETMMSNLLTSMEARQIAENLWGRGGTSSTRTNTKGAFYFSCAGHGGFVIDTRAVDPEQLVNVLKYAKAETVTRYSTSYGKVLGLMTPWRSKGIRIPFDYKAEVFDIIVLEEDCDWALAYMFTTIRMKTNKSDEEMAVHAGHTFWSWFDDKNPTVAARKRADKARAEGHPGLIVSASREDDEHVLVYTADDARHRVTGYDKARDDAGTPWLYLCETVEHLTA